LTLWEATDEEPRARLRSLGGSEGWRWPDGRGPDHDEQAGGAKNVRTSSR